MRESYNLSMNRVCLIVLAILLSGCSSANDRSMGAAADKLSPPEVFASRADIDWYVAALFAGGRADDVMIGTTHYVVLFQHGSGIPILGLVRVYGEYGKRWKRLSEASIPRFEFARAEVKDGKIFAVGIDSGERTMLYAPANNQGERPSHN